MPCARAGCAGGWLHTGDQGFLDEEGFVTLTGRLKELINKGGRSGCAACTVTAPC